MQFRVREDAEQSSGQSPRPSHGTARVPIDGENGLHRDGRTSDRPLPRDSWWSDTVLHWLLARLLPANAASEPQHNSDPDQVRAAAAAGEVSEYDLFRAAWLAWYGTEADSAETEKLFGAYLNGAALPSHVRHFVRRLLCAASDPALDFDRECFGLGKFRRKEPLIRF